jgi:hypothetical protein
LLLPLPLLFACPPSEQQHQFGSKKEIHRNIFKKWQIFDPLRNVLFDTTNSPQTHHEFTIKAPSKKRTFLATPIKKRP